MYPPLSPSQILGGGAGITDTLDSAINAGRKTQSDGKNTKGWFLYNFKSLAGIATTLPHKLEEFGDCPGITSSNGNIDCS